MGRNRDSTDRSSIARRVSREKPRGRGGSDRGDSGRGGSRRDSGRGGFNRGGSGRDSGRGGFNRGGRGRDSGRGGRGDVEMTKVTCSACGKDCEVPFKPTSDKPLFCSDCFEKQDGGNDRRGSDRRGSDRRSGGGSGRDLADINKKLDRIISILED